MKVSKIYIDSGDYTITCEIREKQGITKESGTLKSIDIMVDANNRDIAILEYDNGIKGQINLYNCIEWYYKQ